MNEMNLLYRSPLRIWQNIGEGFMNTVNVRERWCLFNGGRPELVNEARYGRPSVTEDLKDRVDAHR
jgi:hypothetical protein